MVKINQSCYATESYTQTRVIFISLQRWKKSTQNATVSIRIPRGTKYKIYGRKRKNRPLMVSKQCRSSSKQSTDSFQFPQVYLWLIALLHTKCAKQKHKPIKTAKTIDANLLKANKWIRTCIWPKGIQWCSTRREKHLINIATKSLWNWLV